MTNLNQSLKTVTRREVLGGLASSFVLFGAQGASDQIADLYVYPSSRPAMTILAVTLSPVYLGHPLKVRIHAGRNCWTLRPPPSSADTCTPLAVTVPNKALELNGALGIWAELLPGVGKRRRVPSPFLAQLLHEDDLLAEQYHNSQPSEDKANLTEALSRSIARIVRASGGHCIPEEYARRLVKVLLPDLLYYNPRQPVGFTFAAQNGRHPGDPIKAVVRAVLTGFAEG
jgi:hypothetical protein